MIDELKESLYFLYEMDSDANIFVADGIVWAEVKKNLIISVLVDDNRIYHVNINDEFGHVCGSVDEVIDYIKEFI